MRLRKDGPIFSLEHHQYFACCCSPLKNQESGQPRWLSGLAPPSAQGVILETGDQVPRQGPCMEPASPSPASLPLSLSLCVSHE